MIYIIVTCCINNKFGIKCNFFRQQRYITSISKLLELIKNKNVKVILVENNGKRSTYLDNFNCDICYTDNNTLNCFHKGQNELLDIKEVINKYGIDDNDTIIKLTGRYKLLNSDFIDLVISNDYDAYLKFFDVRSKQFNSSVCILGLFAIKCKYLKEFNYSFLKSYDFEFADYVRKSVHNFLEVKQLHLECCFAENLSIQIV